MATRTINNKRPPDQNIRRNGQKFAEGPEFQLPVSVVRTLEERDAIMTSLQVFLKILDSGLNLQGRDFQEDQKLANAAQRVLSRLR